MLDAEIYGLIVALGILLAMLYSFVVLIFYIKENVKLARKFDYDKDIQNFVKKEWVKVYGLIILELVLIAALLLVKIYLF
ncbi:MAG: hypothetical protein IJZ91_00545 [Oscillospiraceae bacterium]|nr:hypothetical protein [Oscillospiraceae bacterium]